MPSDRAQTSFKARPNVSCWSALLGLGYYYINRYLVRNNDPNFVHSQGTGARGML